MRPVGLFGALLLLAACRGKAADDAAQADSTAVVGAATAAAVAQAFPQIVRAIGTVTPRPGRFAELAAPGPTRVARIFVGPGDRVAEGDSLIEFERAPFDAAARSADAALESAQHAYARAERLVQAGILPQKDADQAATDLAQAQLLAVTAHRAQQLATLRAPLAGVVTRMSAVLGASVDPSQGLVQVADPAALDINFNVSSAEAAQIRSGNPVTVTAGEGAGGEPVGQGVVTAVGATVDSVSRAVAVRAQIARPLRPLRIGESLFGRIVTAVHPGAVAVPIAALVPAGDGYQVFVVDSGDVAHARKVTVGARTEALAEIVTGLRAGEVVVTSGAYGVEDGAKIQRTAR
ncbi:MAG TPA: efflux RND transporter periplasmic adaptor subunit [Gemmatimonadales bacterium]|jgi:membrane fusion protein (multidrug efflux system)|nr:efflux RND transporter periplasmic adaptor subunit [Gemmatimonadales bacterium]